MNITKRKLKLCWIFTYLYSLFTLVPYTIIYFMTCFTHWEIIHFFQWVINIPTDSPTVRFGKLFYSLAYLIFIVVYLVAAIKRSIERIKEEDNAANQTRR